MFRCDELMETAYRFFNTAVEPVRQQLSNPEGSFVPAFGELVRQAEEEALSTYTQQTNKQACRSAPALSLTVSLPSRRPVRSARIALPYRGCCT